MVNVLKLCILGVVLTRRGPGRRLPGTWKHASEIVTRGNRTV